MTIEILHRDDLTLGGFAGLKEHRLVIDQRLGWGSPEIWGGLDQFVYLADAKFLPNGETRMHSHKEIDVISVMVEGRISHEGSLEHGKSMVANQTQVQRAGGEGFKHNEINPDDFENRMIQIWVLPQTPGAPAGYKFYDLKENQITQIYGGSKNQKDTFDSTTIIEVGRLKTGSSWTIIGPFMAYLIKGAGSIDSKSIKDGDLVRGDNMSFTASEDTQLIVITT